MILTETATGIRIVRIDGSTSAAPYVGSFLEAYHQIFAEPPYCELFTDDEIRDLLDKVVGAPDHISLFALDRADKVVGFGLGVPAHSRRDIARELSGLVPVTHSFYLAELGILASHRRQGLGKLLVRIRMRLIDAERYTHVVLRTSAERNASYEMYMSLGFDDMGVYMQVPSRREGGGFGRDRRLFLSKVLVPDDADTDGSNI